MGLPFGIQLKGFIIGVLVAYFVLPYIMGMFARAGGGGSSRSEP